MHAYTLLQKKYTLIDFIQFSWWSWVTDLDPGLCWVCQMIWWVIDKRPHLKFLYRPFHKTIMIWGLGQWPRSFGKLGCFFYVQDILRNMTDIDLALCGPLPFWQILKYNTSESCCGYDLFKDISTRLSLYTIHNFTQTCHKASANKNAIGGFAFWMTPIWPT